MSGQNTNLSSEDTKKLEFNQFQKSDKAPFTIYGDLEYIIKRNDGCKNDPEHSSTTKVSEQCLRYLHLEA